MSEEHYTYYFIGDYVSGDTLKKSVQEGKLVYAVFPHMGWEDYDFLIKLNNEKKLKMILDNEEFFWTHNLDVLYILADKVILNRLDFPLWLDGCDGKKMFCFECDNKSGEMSDKKLKEWLEKLSKDLGLAVHAKRMDRRN